MEIHTSGRRNGPSVVEIVIAFLILALVCTLIVTIMAGFVDEANPRARAAEAMAIVIAARSAAQTQYAEYGNAVAGTYVWDHGQVSSDSLGNASALFTEIRRLTEMDDALFGEATLSIQLESDGSVREVTYMQYGHTIVCRDGERRIV